MVDIKEKLFDSVPCFLLKSLKKNQPVGTYSLTENHDATFNFWFVNSHGETSGIYNLNSKEDLEKAHH